MYGCQRARDLVIVIVYNNNGEAVVRVVTVGNNLVSNGFSVKYLQVLANILDDITHVQENCCCRFKVTMLRHFRWKTRPYNQANKQKLHSRFWMPEKLNDTYIMSISRRSRAF
ncbi:hypothetical protein GQX74_008381 [Glossina fuscipes]|nr:hypothetical protein GQX74_008381 [Glossina fuscipes]